MFLKDAWYVAAFEHDLGTAPLAVTILGEAVLLYRKSDGSAVALEDACPHRKLPLSMGRIKGDEIECGYHGLMFNGTGACVRAPGNDRIPSGARVRAYPLESRYGLLWIWMGTVEKADPATIFAVEHWGDPAWGMNRGDRMTVDCNYLYVTDNLLDPSHVSWVHQTSFASAACEETPLEISETETGVTVSRWMLASDPAPFYVPFLKFSGLCDRKQQYEVRYPSHALIRAIFTPAGTGGDDKEWPEDVFLMDSYNFMTPIDEDHTAYFWFQMRNFAPGDAAVSAQFSASVRAAFEEDRVILTAVHRGMANKKTPNLNLRIDGGPTRFRRRMDRLIAAEAGDRLAAE